MSKTATKNSITLKGSAAIIKEYLSKNKTSFLFQTYFFYFIIIFFTDYGINSILFQRGIYPAENFTSVQQYGLTILMSKDEKIKEFLTNVLTKAEGNLFFLQLSVTGCLLIVGIYRLVSSEQS